MSALTTHVVPNVGADISTQLTAAGGSGDTAVCGTGMFLAVKNTNAAACTVTIACPQLTDGRLATASSVSPAIPATTGFGMIPLLPIYADPATGLASISYSVTSGVTVAVVRVP